MGLSTRDLSAGTCALSSTPTRHWKAGGLRPAGQGTVATLLLQEDLPLL